MMKEMRMEELEVVNKQLTAMTEEEMHAIEGGLGWTFFRFYCPDDLIDRYTNPNATWPIVGLDAPQ